MRPNVSLVPNVSQSTGDLANKLDKIVFLQVAHTLRQKPIKLAAIGSTILSSLSAVSMRRMAIDTRQWKAYSSKWLRANTSLLQSDAEYPVVLLWNTHDLTGGSWISTVRMVIAWSRSLSYKKIFPSQTRGPRVPQSGCSSGT